MAVPATIDQFLTLLRRSELVDADGLDSYLAAARSAGSLPETPSRLAKAMMRDGLVTHYQASQLLMGRYKNFFISDKYKVLERLGSGGMASVFLCEHRLMRRPVALKILPALGEGRPDALERFHREARAVARLHHPNIVRAYDIDHHGKIHFLVMEYIYGLNLEDFVTLRGPMEPLRAADYIRQAALGLQHAHESGLVHRDIKPSNLLVDHAGTVKLLDLGLARFAADEIDMLTKRGDLRMMLGTVDFMAPEQILDSHDVDGRADIYGLGATFYYLLTGRGLFGEATPAQKLASHQYSRPVPLRGLRADVPEGLAAIVDRMLAKDRADRHQSPSEVVAALDPWVGDPVPPPLAEDAPRLSPAALKVIRRPPDPRVVPLGNSSSDMVVAPGPSGSDLLLAMPMPPPAPTPAPPALPDPPAEVPARRKPRWARWVAFAFGLTVPKRLSGDR